MRKSVQDLMVTLLSSIALSGILLSSTDSFGAAKKRKAETAPGVNVDFWAVDPDARVIRYVSADGTTVKNISLDYLTPDDRLFVSSLIAWPSDHAAFYINIFQTGCIDWRDSAYKKVKEWNARNPDAKVSLEKAK